MAHALGYLPDAPDDRDHVVRLTAPVPVPRSLNLATDPAQPPIWDQSSIGSCTAHGIIRAFLYTQKRHRIPGPEMASRLKLYRDERALEGTVDEDAGAQIRDGLKVVANLGVCDEALWPYDVTRFTEEPPPATVADALTNRAVGYARVPQTAAAMRQVLANGQLIVVGFTVYESFESAKVAKSGRAPMPTPGEQALGGHCVCVVGYTPSTWICANSWGTGWGNRGYFTLPTSYLTGTIGQQLSQDFWTIAAVI